MSLVELQKFLADELAQAGGESHFGRAFRPLTDGLGIGAAAKKPVPQAPAPPPKAPVVARSGRIPVPDATKFFESFPTETSAPLIPVREPDRTPERPRVEVRQMPEPRPAPVEAPTHRVVTPEARAEIAPAPEAAVQPPPVPQASFFRRLLAGIVDQIFVLSLVTVVLLITSIVLSREGGALSKGLLMNLRHPAYIRFAILGFATIWMSYLVLGVGILDMTFGMWVWGLRIGYGQASEGSPLARKVMRVICSFFLEALVLPAPLLAVRIKGRNLIDWLSGSYLYRTA